MHITNDLSGKKFGKLSVICRIENTDKKHSYYKCRCDCGNICIKRSDIIKNSQHKQCGMCKRPRLDMTTHGHSNTHLYRVYYAMKQRCYNINCSEYHNYGARDIKVCDEWLNSFTSFYDWAINNGYRKSLQLDRIDNDDDYKPSNCRFVTPIENSNNKRTCVYLTHKGTTMTMTQWARHLGINENTFWRYVRKKNYSLEYIIDNYCVKEVVW